MDKGIRPACNAKFVEALATRVNTREGNCAFRKNVMFYVMEEFGITLASAATHYNHSFQAVKLATPELVEGLGRADDKKGGRKPKAVVVAEAVAVLLGTPEGAAPEAATLLSEGVKENTSTLTVTVNPAADDSNDAGETAPEQTVFTVKKKSDDTVIGTFSFEDAKALVAKAAAAKKAKLYYV